VPELPEVERFRRYLAQTSLHQTVEQVSVTDRRILHGVTVRGLGAALKGGQFARTARHGKYLLAELNRGGWLVLHFGMSGRLQQFRFLEGRPPHSRVIVRFQNGVHLAFVCMRMFGEVSLTAGPDALVAERRLGPDALAVTRAAFLEQLDGRTGMIKPILMNQRVVAGLGNLYADEILFQARIHPETPVRRLGRERLGRVFSVMRRVLRLAVRRHAQIDAYPSSYLLPRRGDDQPCPRCGRKLVRSVVGGRGTYHCSACQRRPRG